MKADRYNGRMNHRLTSSSAWLSTLILGLSIAACGGDDDDKTQTLDDFLPELPAETGDAQDVWAGEITGSNLEELIEGPASSGMPGDFFMRNSKARFVIQAATRVIGVIPQGGNLVDAVPLGPDGKDAAVDHFGEFSMVYRVGRTCRHDTIEVLRDGSAGGAAVIRARGMAEVNQFINLRGMGLLSIPFDLDPAIEDEVECATTYMLESDSSALQVWWTLHNPSEEEVDAPFGAFNDTGGDTEAWTPTRGFERLGISALSEATDPAPVDYVVYQGPGVAYGILPQHEDAATPNVSALIAGVSILLFKAESLLDMLNRDFNQLKMAPGKGFTQGMQVVVGFDAAAAEEAFRRQRDEEVATLSGTVAWTGGGVPAGARVSVFEDAGETGVLDEDDVIRTYINVDAAGDFSGSLAPGNYLVVAEVQDQARSAPQTIELKSSGTSDVSFSLDAPVAYDYTIVTDDKDGNYIPGKIQIIGVHPITPDKRTFETYDRYGGLVKMLWSVRGTSTDIGDGADPQIILPVGSTYRILVSRGTEWSIDTLTVTPKAGETPDPLEFKLTHVIDTTGYISSEHHVHLVGSPDSPVLQPDRVATMVADGVELFTSTDHDYVSDLQPVIESMNLTSLVRNIAGLEVTPFAFGHFNTFPLTPDNDSPNHGAIDWTNGGADNLAMLPGDIFAAMREKGAKVVQVNHPRNTNGITDFMQYFDRAGLKFDHDKRTIETDSQPVPNDWLRLPGTTLWSIDFNAIEVWNGFEMGDTNQDGVREVMRLDKVLRDWFNFLSIGLPIVPLGNSDTHTAVKDPGGMPRTYVRVSDDSAEAIKDGSVVADMMDTLTGNNDAPIDVVVTNGPHIEILANDSKESVLGKVVVGDKGEVVFDITVQSPAWAQIDTIEVFANMTPKVGRAVEDSALSPIACATSRKDVQENDLCANAPLGGTDKFRISMVKVGNSQAYSLRAVFQFSGDEIKALNRKGATDGDAWFVFRVSGSRAIFPLLLTGILDDKEDVDVIDVIVNGDSDELDKLFINEGVPAVAFTSPVYVDFDGNGYTPIFSPE